MNIKSSYILPVAMITALTACGGGGSGGGAGNGSGGTDSPPSGGSGGGNSGSITALFASTAAPRYHLISSTGQTFGALTGQQQLNDGAVIKINDNSLDGDNRSVRDIAGDANFALGRWNAGTVTRSNGTTETLTGTQGSDYHYVLFNTLSAFPSSGTYNCDTGSFTTPRRSTGTVGPVSGTVMGSANVSFGSNGANVSGALTITASNSATVSLNSNPNSSTTTAFTGGYLSNGSGAAIQIGDGGSPAVTVVGSYVAKIDGSSYIGTYRFLCSAPI